MLLRKRSIKNIRKITALALTVLAVPFLVGSHALAAPATANVLKVSPVRTDTEIQPGASKTVNITITNPTDLAISIHPVENDFIAGDERGTPAIILDETKYAPTHSLKRFMKPLTDVAIPAKQSKTIPVVVSVPKNAQPGGYFGAVRFVPSVLGQGGQVNLNASAASLILLTVPGKMVEKLNLTDFAIQQNGKTGEWFGSPDDLQVTTRFQNEGSLQEAPFGKISVTKDKKVVYEADFNNKDPRDMVLPDSARRWDVPLKDIGNFGQYTVSATFTYGKNNQTIQVTKSFWVIPQMVIIGAVVAVLVLIALIVGIWLFLRNYKRRILRKNSGSGLKFH